MRTTVIIMLILTFTLYGQSKSIEERLRSKDTEERMKAIEEVIEKKIMEAKPIIEEEIDKQELWLKPLYIEALKVLDSDKVDESLENYFKKIVHEAHQQNESIDEEAIKNIIKINKEILKYSQEKIIN
ncbi:MAG: hypothetical protein WHS65_05095 [Melioribacteraceae bacterium]